MKHLMITRSLLAGAAMVIFASPAFALDGKDMMDKLTAAYALYGSQISYTVADVDGTTVTARNVRVKIEDAKQPVDLPLGDVTFSDVEETEGGGYYAGSVSFQDIDKTEQDTRITAKDLGIEGLTIPGKPLMDSIDGMVLYESAHAGPIAVSSKSKTLFSIAASDANINIADDNSSIGFDLKLDGIVADLSTVEDPKSKDIINKLNLQNINGQMTMKGSWEAATGKVDVSEYSFDAKDIGKLNINFSLSGYTTAFMKAMQETAKAAEANPDKQSAQTAMNMAMMGLLQQLTFNSAAIRFDDASITKRVLDYVGQQQGVSGQQLAEMVKGMLPIMIAQMQMPDLQNMISAAVNKFLDDPKNLEVKAAPANPVPVPMIMGAAMGAPQTTPQLLGVTVTANQ